MELLVRPRRLDEEITVYQIILEENMKRTLFVSLLALLVLSACGVGAASTPAAYDNFALGGAPARQELPAAEAPMPADAIAAQSNKATSSTTVENYAAQQKRLVIQNADLTIVVTDPEAKMKAIAKLAEGMGGFVVSSNLYQTKAPNGLRVPAGSIVVRVPSEQLDQALTQIKDGVVEVQSENRSGQDVTKEYVDLTSRLKNLEAAEAQLTKILENADKTEDVLNVFNQLTSIREQIEVVKGQIKYYEESAALSAVSINLVAEETIKPLEIGGWKPQGVARDAIQNLIDFLQNFVDFMIRFFLYYLWVLLLVLLPFYLVFLGLRAIYRRTHRNKKAPPEEQA
jgi:hypothetical protein